MFDVEAGAWSLGGAMSACSRCTAPRPTIYCDMSTYLEIPRDCPWDLWIARPGMTDDDALRFAASDHRIVAVQNVWANIYDRSVVIDNYWPEKPPVSRVLPGIPTGIEFKAYPVVSQINAKCAPSDGPQKMYRWQAEKLTIHGWEYVGEQDESSVYVTFRNIEPGCQYRIRVSKGNWSEWVHVNT